MKTADESIITSFDENEMKELIKETKETIATGLLKENGFKATFAMVDLWRVQKKQRTLGSSTKWRY